MNIIAIDTVSSVISVTAEGPRGRCTVSLESGIQHAETLLSLIDTALDQAGFPAAETGLVLCAEGPGSFTGLRIAYAAAKGIQLAANCPLRPIPTLHCYARPFRTWNGNVLAVLDAKKKRFYVQFFSNGSPVSEPEDCTAVEAVTLPDRTVPLLVTGPDAGLFARSLGEFRDTFHGTVLPFGREGISRQMVEIALSMPVNYTENNDSSAPHYVRKSDAESAR